DFQRETGFARDAVKELRTVHRATAGFGRHLARGAHTATLHLLRAALERIDGAVHGIIRQPARTADAFTEARDPREGIDDAKFAADSLAPPVVRTCWAGDQHAAVVGAEVDGGEDLAVIAVGAL